MREEILKGKLNFPGSALFIEYPEHEKTIKKFWNSIWFNYLNGNETNSIYWYEQLGIKVFNDVVRRLSSHGWIVSRSLVGRRWASIEFNEDNIAEYVNKDEIEATRAKYKYSKYMLGLEKSILSKAVKQNGEIKETGLIREGFRNSGNTQFGYDMAAMAKYEYAVIKNLTKSMDKIRKLYPEMKSTISSYDEVSVGIYNTHKENPLEVYTTGENINDSRGRAISSSLSRAANPISNKDFRAALVITY